MKSKKRQLKKSQLYAIIDKSSLKTKSSCGFALKLNKSAVDIIQFRDKLSPKKSILKESLALRNIFHKSGQLFIVNDHLDIAKIIDSDGVHLGQGDFSLKLARKILGKDKVIGISCHNLNQAIEAQKNGADYIGFGPIFPTITKPGFKAIGLNALKKLNRQIKIPYFVIGGITKNNLDLLISNRVTRISCCGEFLRSTNLTNDSIFLKRRLASS